MARVKRSARRRISGRSVITYTDDSERQAQMDMKLELVAIPVTKTRAEPDVAPEAVSCR
jgi:hypothetical protein